MFSSLKARLYLLILVIALPGVVTIYLHADEQREQAINQHKALAVETARKLFFSQEKLIRDTKAYLKYLSTVSEVKDPASRRLRFIPDKYS